MVEKKWFDWLVRLFEVGAGYGVLFDGNGRFAGFCRLDDMFYLTK